MSIDLHSHTTASDGTLSPAAVVRLAHESGLSAVAVTDHDTVAGLPEALAEGKRLGIEVIPGCELSVGEGRQSMHIVGLWLPENPANLSESLEYVINARGRRNHEIVAKLNELGVDVTYEEVKKLAGGTVGRPHMARVLVEKGVVPSINKAFSEYLGNDGKAYIPRTRLSPAQALDVLRKDGATPVLAHPYILGQTLSELEKTVRELMDLGLEGMETDYTEHPPDIRKAYRDMADRLGLLKSGGSDFHGDAKPAIRLRYGRGDLDVPDQYLDAFKAHRRAKGLWTT